MLEIEHVSLDPPCEFEDGFYDVAEEDDEDSEYEEQETEYCIGCGEVLVSETEIALLLCPICKHGY